MRIDPPGVVPGQAARMTEIWAWTVIDPRTGVEGILAARMPKGAIPMVGSVRATMEQYAPFARTAAKEVGGQALLRRFVSDE